MKTKKLLAFVIVCLLIGSLGSSTYAEELPMQRRLDVGNGWEARGGIAGALMSTAPVDGGTNLVTFTSATNFLAPCGLFDSIGCVETIYARRAGDLTWIQGEYVGERIRSNPFGTEESSLFNLFNLGTPRNSGIYTFGNVSHSNGNLFEVIAPQYRFVNSANRNPLPGHSLKVAVRAVYESVRTKEGSACWGEFTEECCILETNPTCWKLGSIDNLEFRIVFRFDQLPEGWVHGRLSDVEISYEVLPNTSQLPARVTLTGRSVKTPILQKTYWPSDPGQYAEWERMAPLLSQPWSYGGFRGVIIAEANMDLYASLIKLSPSLDRSSRLISMWDANFVWGRQQNSVSCGKSQFQGFVGSNALLFASNVPTFDGGSLNYKMSSPHYSPDGQEFSGIYELLVDEKYARCVWGLSGVNYSATLSVLDEGGNQKVATTNLGKVGQFFKFRATGFTFSGTTIKAKLISKSAPAKMPKKTVKTKSKRITITCKKGISLKQVIGLKPICPKGYIKITKP